MRELDGRRRILRHRIEQHRAFRSRRFPPSRQHAAPRIEWKVIELGAVAGGTGKHQIFPGPRQPPVALVTRKGRPMFCLPFRTKVLDWIGSGLDRDLAVAALPRLRFVERLARFLAVVPVAELVQDTASSRIADAPQLLGTDAREGAGGWAAVNADHLGLLPSRHTQRGAAGPLADGLRGAPRYRFPAWIDVVRAQIREERLGLLVFLR